MGEEVAAASQVMRQTLGQNEDGYTRSTTYGQASILMGVAWLHIGKEQEGGLITWC